MSILASGTDRDGGMLLGNRRCVVMVVAAATR